MQNPINESSTARQPPMPQVSNPITTRDGAWLIRYYAVRAAFSLTWVAIAFSLGKVLTPLGAVFLVAYPLWDALANIYDAKRNGGFRANPTQAFNAVVSTIVAATVVATLQFNIHAILTVFGVWAALSGILQLATGVRRWRKFSGQWPMILSGAQSVLAATHFVKLSAAGVMPTSADVAPYAAFGAIYFAISAISLAVAAHRHLARDLALNPMI
jgi:uncharacterized membrane protein HdeD (DUF308 family)